LAVLVLSLQQDLVAAADLVQQDLPFAHFFFFLPLSAKDKPVTSKAAVASNNTFFMLLFLL